jgi:hypothetical protein
MEIGSMPLGPLPPGGVISDKVLTFPYEGITAKVIADRL